MEAWTLGHYEVLERLGEGGMGAVYKARDRKLERYIALKTITPGKMDDPDRRRRFVQEAKAASALNHPNIITIHEIDQSNGTDYIAMEYIEGRTLRALLEKPCPPESLLPILRQLAEALSVAHAAGIVHRDIKPDNVMLRDDGYVKVLDFGLARLSRPAEVPDDNVTQPGMVLGTARYMSPEQARGEPAESPSDVFSLGVMAYELLTGAHPFFSGPGPAAVWAVLSEDASPPTRLNPEIPATLEDLVLRMLAKEAVLRPSAATVLAELQALGHGGSPTAAPRIVPLRRASVGRDREIQELQDAFAAAAAGAGTLLCVTGEPGLGKTTLVEEFLDALRTKRGSAWVARGRCSERLGSTDALLPILEALDSLLRGDSGDQAARTLKRFAPNWYLQVAPSLGDPTREALAEEVRTASPERMKRELFSFLEELARVRPLVLFLDDVQWSDVSTGDLLSFLGSRGRDLPVLLIATYRPSEVLATKHLFLQVRQQWQARAACRDLPLGFLARADVERLVALRFPEHRFPEELLSLLHAKTEGNPLFVTDLLRYLRDTNILKQEDKGWTLTRPLAEIEKEMPATVRSTIQLKIDGFSDADRKLLVAASVQGVAFDSAVLAKALARDPAEVEERLQDLDAVHDFVRAAGEQEFPDRTLTVRYRFVHVFYQNALYASLAPSRRAALSGAIGEAILAFGGDKVPGLAADLAFLFESARDFARATPFFLAASRHAARLFAYPEAAILAQKGLRALETTPESAERTKRELLLSVTLGVSLMATTGYASPEVERVHLRSRELCLRLGDQKRLLPTLWALYAVYLIRGELKRAFEVAQELQGPAETSAPADRIQALHAMGVTLAYMGRNQEAREYLARIVEQFDPRHHPYHASVYVLDPIITSLCVMSRVLAIMGHIDQALAQVNTAVERAQRLVHPQSLAYSTFWQAWIRHDRGEVEAALERAEAAMALCKEHGLYQIGAWARAARGWALCAQGRLGEGVVEVRKSLEAQEQMHSALERPYCLGILARGLAQQGQHEAALKCLDEAMAMVEAHEDRGYEAEIHRLRGEALLSRALEDEATAERDGGELVAQPRREDPFQAAAAAAFERAIAIARRAEAHTLELRAAISLFRLRRNVGEPEPARAMLTQAVAWFTEGRETPHLVEARRLLGTA